MPRLLSIVIMCWGISSHEPVSIQLFEGRSTAYLVYSLAIKPQECSTRLTHGLQHFVITFGRTAQLSTRYPFSLLVWREGFCSIPSSVIFRVCCSWWRGPKGSELVADVLFMNYANIFLNVLERLESTAPAATAQQLRRESEHFKLNRKAAVGSETSEEVSRDGGISMGAGRGEILPAPRWCRGWRFCEGAGNYRCANTYLPLGRRKGSRLVDLVAERTPVVNSNRTQFTAEPTAAHWALTLDEVKPNILAYMSAIACIYRST